MVRMSTPASDDVPIRRIDRILAFMSLGIALLSIICFFAIIIGTATGMEQSDFGRASGRWSPRSRSSACRSRSC